VFLNLRLEAFFTGRLQCLLPILLILIEFGDGFPGIALRANPINHVCGYDHAEFIGPG
jgi:hypothetical protein